MIHWLFESAQNLTEPPEAFLSAAELKQFSSFRFEKRRDDWLLGRWTAKRLIQAVLLDQTHELAGRGTIEIANDATGAPHVFALDRLPNLEHLNLSLSHSNAHALCAVSDGPIGADLEWVETRDKSFLNDYFTTNERACVNGFSPAQRDLVTTALWSAKETVLKVFRKGLSVDTHTVEISIAPFGNVPEEWTPFKISLCAGVWSPVSDNSAWSSLSGETASGKFAQASLSGWWRAQDGFVMTLAAGAEQAPDEIPLTPEAGLVTAGDLHEGHGLLPRRIAQATRHHARHAARN